MKFFDKKERDLSDEVYTIKKIKDVLVKKDSDNVDGVEELQLLRELPQTQGLAFFKTTVRCLNIGDAIFNVDSVYITYRTE